ncbi:MAG TPA: WG repeat-containing protein [bacterium]|nr:WG repeat-containing protein [bacterium]
MPRRKSAPPIRYGFIDEAGGWAIPPSFDDVSSFSDGLAAAARRGRYGFVDHTGAWVLEPRFSMARKFEEGFAWVADKRGEFRIDRAGRRHAGWLGRTVQGRRRLCVGGTRLGDAPEPTGGTWGFTDGTGKVVVEPRYTGNAGENPPDYAEGLAVCRRGEIHVGAESGYDVVDLAGKVILEALAFVEMRSFHEGRALVKVFGQGCGFVDRDGRLVIEARWSSANRFSGGRAAVCDRAGAWGFVDTGGQQVIPCRFSVAHEFSEGKGLVGAAGRFGFAELDGTVGDLQWERANSYSGGRAVVSSRAEGAWGAIDPAGRLAVPENFRTLSSFADGVARAEPASERGAERRVGYLGIDGEWRVPPEFDELGSWQQLILARRGAKWGFVDQTGRERIPFRYDRGRSRFFEGLAALGVVETAASAAAG